MSNFRKTRFRFPFALKTLTASFMITKWKYDFANHVERTSVGKMLKGEIPGHITEL